VSLLPGVPVLFRRVAGVSGGHRVIIFRSLPQDLEMKAVAVGSSMARRAEDARDLAVFRRELHGCFTARADALMDLCDAVLCADGPVRSVAELSLSGVPPRARGAV
jgi:hypothetical protein